MYTRRQVAGVAVAALLSGLLGGLGLGRYWPAARAMSANPPRIPAGCGRPVQTPARPEPASRLQPGQQVLSPYYHRVHMATSADGLSWVADERILFDHMSVPDVTLTADGRLLLVALDFTDSTGTLVQAESRDLGKTWSSLRPLEMWGWRGNAVDPDIVELRPGCYRLTFASTSFGGPRPHRIHTAVSPDGVRFILEEGVRLEMPHVFDPDVVKVGDTWRIYLGHAEPGQPGKTVSASSPDGLTYTLDPGDRASGSIPGGVLRADGTLLLYTVDRDMRAWTSANGLRFSDQGLIRGFRGADPSPVRLKDGSYLMIYKTIKPGAPMERPPAPTGTRPGPP